jgi:hypothetical protein
MGIEKTRKNILIIKLREREVKIKDSILMTKKIMQ